MRCLPLTFPLPLRCLCAAFALPFLDFPASALPFFDLCAASSWHLGPALSSFDEFRSQTVKSIDCNNRRAVR